MNLVARRHLGRWLERVRQLRALWHRPGPSGLNEAFAGGHLDAVRCDGDGIVAVEGWCADLQAFERGLRLRVGDAVHPPSQVFRVPRADVVIGSALRPTFAGAIAEWVLHAFPTANSATLVADGRDICSLTLRGPLAVPYGHLHSHPEVLGRGHIYASGAPNHIVSSEVLALASTLPPPVLDFGCGAGALVRALRGKGIEAYGLDVDGPLIREYLLPDAKPYVTLYDGTLPAPFSDRQFTSVVCSEVLEHMPDPHAAAAELARLASRMLLVTVPDMSAIPRGYQHAVVPWHLLESTHVNFFTQASLVATIAPYARDLEASRLGRVACDRLQFFTSLAVLAELRS